MLPTCIAHVGNVDECQIYKVELEDNIHIENMVCRKIANYRLPIY